MYSRGDAYHRYSEGQRLFGAGEYEAAITEFTMALTNRPNYINAYHRRAEAYQKLGMEDDATADLEMAESIRVTRRHDAPLPMNRTDDGATMAAIIGGTPGILMFIWTATSWDQSDPAAYFAVFLLVLSIPVTFVGALAGAIAGGVVAHILHKFIKRSVWTTPLSGPLGGIIGGSVIPFSMLLMYYLWWYSL